MPPISGIFQYQSEQRVTVHDFQSLFEKHYPGVYKHVYFLTHDKAAAEDISQDTFIKLYNSCPISLKNPVAWLNKVATNLTYNFLNGEKSRREKEVTLQKIYLVKPETSEETILKKEEKDTVKNVLGTLPIKERMCLLLRFSGFSYEEISEAIRIPKASVGKTLSRAKAKFREAYLDMEGSENR